MLKEKNQSILISILILNLVLCVFFHFSSDSGFSYYTVFILSLVALILTIRFLKSSSGSTGNKAIDELFRNTFENSNTGIYVSALDGKFLRVNKRMCEITGFSEEEFKKLTIENISYPQDYEISINHRKALLMDEKSEVFFEKRLIHKKGDIIWVQVSASLVNDDDNLPKYFINNIQDITRQKKLELFYHDLFMKAPFAYHSMDSSGNIIDANAQWLCLTGYSKKDIIGKPFDTFLLEPYSNEIFRKNLAMVEKGRNLNGEFDFVKKNNKVIRIRIESKVRFDDNSYIDNIHCVIQDLTEKIFNEKQRLKTELHLRQAFKMDSIGLLTGGIAHDFNNILSIIIGNSELALMQIPKKSPARNDIEMIKDTALRGSEIVKNLLNFSNKTTQKLNEINLSKAIKNSLKLVRSEIPPNINIEDNTLDSGILISGDLSQIDSILMNLCLNSSRAIGNRKGTIRVSLSKVFIERIDIEAIPSAKPGSYIKISVEDDGCGIDPFIAHKIFDPYFTTRDTGDGKGMGLAIVLGILKNHDGSVKFRSEPGRGTEFEIYFPVKDKANEKLRDITGSESLLFLDDDKPICELSKQSLEKLGYRVEVFTDPASALDHFRDKQENYDLIITDMTMPQMDGINFAEKIKEMRSDIPVILCSGFTSKIDEETLLREEIASFVRKPFIVQDLAETIRDVLENY